MMDLKFYIVDDDDSIRGVLRNIIYQYGFGEVIGEADNGFDAIKDIKTLQPDIVLVDLLLPELDGISIVADIRKCKFKIAFIMISQVNSQEMISQAYEMKIEFYINKPINVIEVRSVINNVKEKIKMEKIIHSFERAFSSIGELEEYSVASTHQMVTRQDQVNRIFFQLGIAGEAGSGDLIEMIMILLEQDEIYRNGLINQKMYQLYEMLKERYNEFYNIALSTSAFEQRIRRTISKALNNLANLGIEDYGNEIFLKYSNALFDFKEVRKQMNYIRKKSNISGKINIKKFIEGIIIQIKNE